MSTRPSASSTSSAARCEDMGSFTCARHVPGREPDHRLVARHRRSRCSSRGLLSAGEALLVGVFLLTGCSIGGATTRRTPVQTVTAVPTCTPQLGPCPVSGLLDPPPQRCPASPSLDSLNFSHFGGFVGGVQFVGHAPVWIPRPYLGGSTVPITIHAEQNGYTPFPGTKIVWEVGPNYTQPVSVQMIDLRTGALAWWSLDATHSARTFVLDPAMPQGDTYHRSPEPGWHEWGSGVTIAEAGCYSLQVTWPGGNWRVIVAAGR